ncbi:TPR repeat protein [Limnobacter thiooxidans]|nr:tetratricopeptide repeat protein [Limnobacter sp.]MCZ8014740.1 tetratricopeptide repeat protein [Limnobacter sp.]RZS40627.1 TPR repeat protein [Limnobacter thiooxidans]
MPSSLLNRIPANRAFATFVLPLVLAACATPPAGNTTSDPAPSPEVNNTSSSMSATSPPQQALIEAERKEELREDEQSRKARVEREKNLHLKLVQTMVEQDNAYAALAHLDAYDQKWGSDRPSKQLRADALRKTSQLDQAELVYKSLLGGKEQVKSGPAWYGLGKVSIERGDLKGAVTRLEKSIQVDPLNINAYSDLGLVYLLEGQKEPAYNTLMKANQLASGDVKVMANLALWGLVYDDFNMAMDIADRLQWSDNTRNQVMSQANSIKRRFDAKGN